MIFNTTKALLIVISLTSLTAHASNQTLCFIDSNSILEQSPLTQKVVDEMLNNRFKTQIEHINGLQTDIATAQATYLNKQGMLSSAERIEARNKLKSLQYRLADEQSALNSASSDYVYKTREATYALLDKAIEKHMKVISCDTLMNSKVAVRVNPKYDITEAVASDMGLNLTF